MPAISFIVGIDQTGARHPRRPHMAKPLPLALVYRQKDHWQISVSNPEKKQALYIKKFNYETLIGLQEAAQIKEGPIIAAIDCVLGLPCNITYNSDWGHGRSLLLSLFLQAAHYRMELKKNGFPPYGLEASREFFRQLYPNPIGTYSRTKPPQRWVEDLIHANSVFRERPFQKNIQSGTYRIWSDLGNSSHLDRVHIWPFDDIKRCQAGDVLLIECYPSHLWRVDWNINRRNPQRLIAKLKSLSNQEFSFTPYDLKVLAESPDHCDALVNALGYYLRWQSDPATIDFPDIKRVIEKEGWILGAQASAEKLAKEAAKLSCHSQNGITYGNGNVSDLRDFAD